MASGPELDPAERQRIIANLNVVARYMAKGGRMPSRDGTPLNAERPVDRAQSRGLWAGVTAAGATLLGALKFAKFGKVLLTALSMGVMIWAYARTSPLAFAVGFVLLIFIHEMGHALVIRRVGLNAGWPVFIPFVGAFITLRDAPLTALTNAQIGIAGPVAGGIASLVCAGIFAFTGDPLYANLALTGFWLNLFNLIPVSPLDGGRTLDAVAPLAIWFGAAGLGTVSFLFHSPMLGIVALIMLVRAFGSLGRKKPHRVAYFNVSPGWTAAITALYFGLAASLGVGGGLIAVSVAQHTHSNNRSAPTATFQAPDDDP
jgi:Zn-dependent protease